jgi:hypothetical protein
MRWKSKWLRQSYVSGDIEIRLLRRGGHLDAGLIIFEDPTGLVVSIYDEPTSAGSKYSLMGSRFVRLVPTCEKLSAEDAQRYIESFREAVSECENSKIEVREDETRM